MSEKNKNTGPYSAAVIEQYLQGKLSPEEMHEIEKAALDDPMLTDAIEGMSIALEKKGSASLTGDLNELQQRLRERIQPGKTRSIAPISYRYWLQTAAVLFVLIIGGVMAYYAIRKNASNEKSIAQDVKTFQPKADSSIKDAVPAPLTDSTDTNLKKAKEPVVARKEKKESEKSLHATQQAAGNARDVASAAPQRDREELKKNAPTENAADADSISDDKRVAPSAARAEFFSPERPGSFTGKVTDQHNNPIAAAQVELKDKKIAAVTDENGNFRINTKDHDTVVAVNIKSVGYESAVSELSSSGSPNVIVLRERQSSLQEVVVSGVGANKKSKPYQSRSQDAVPVSGWDEYSKYLQENKKYTGDSLGLRGPVVVSFFVDKKGRLSSFLIEQSLGPDYDEEAIRLIKEGPPWKLLKDKAAKVKVVVTF